MSSIHPSIPIESETRLSHLQVRFFRDNGFLRLSGVFGTGELDEIQDQVNTDLERGEEPVRRDENGRIYRLSRVFDRSEYYKDMFTNGRLLGHLKSLLGPNIIFVQNRHNHVTFNAGTSKAGRLHRDVLQWSRPIVTAVIYLSDTICAEECTRVIPSSHFLPFVGTPNNGGTWMDEHHVFSDLLDQAIPVPMRRGQVLLMDGLVFHAAGRLVDPTGTRIVATAAFRSVDELIDSQDPNTFLVCGEQLFRGDT